MFRATQGFRARSQVGIRTQASQFPMWLLHAKRSWTKSRTQLTYVSSLIPITLLSMCRTWMRWAMEADERYYLGNMDSINITPVHPVSVLHSYLIPLWTYQNILHIIVNTYARQERLETRRERNQMKEIIRGKSPSENKSEQKQKSLLCCNVCLFNMQEFAISDTPRLCLGRLGPRPKQRHCHPGGPPEWLPGEGGPLRHSTEARARFRRHSRDWMLVTFQVIIWNSISSN